MIEPMDANHIFVIGCRRFGSDRDLKMPNSYIPFIVHLNTGNSLFQ